MTSRCLGAVLAGGAGRRLGGSAKGLLEVGGVRIIDRVRAALHEGCDEVLLIANDPEAVRWLPGVRVIPDARVGLGAAGGVHAALVAAQGADVVVVAWDLPFVTASMVRLLRSRTTDVDAVVCEKLGSRWGVEPLCGCYRAACLPALERRLGDGDVRAGAWLADVRLATVGRETLAEIGDPDMLLMDVDTEQDLAAARRHAEATA